MTGDDLVFHAVCDLTAQVRGRGVPLLDYELHPERGTGWVPANQSLTAFGPLAEETTFDAVGELRLRPDPSTRARIELGDASPLDLVLCDVAEQDNSDWSACARTYCRDALAELTRETGLSLIGSFEHEFTIVDGAEWRPFLLGEVRRREPLLPLIARGMRQAGCEPENLLPEYGAGQFELTSKPTAALAAADRSVLTRVVTGEVARLLSLNATFSPVVVVDGIGNGVHVHFGLVEASGAPAGIGAVGMSFAAGVLRHIRALTALSAASPVSFLRLKPHRWSAATAALGRANREAALRIAGQGPSEHLEYRAADATACPYLTLGGLVHAGLAGIRDGLPAPELLERDPSNMSAAELAGFTPLPTSLEEALDELRADSLGLPPLLLDTYIGLKHAELALCDGLDDAARVERYIDVF